MPGFKDDGVLFDLKNVNPDLPIGNRANLYIKNDNGLYIIYANGTSVRVDGIQAAFSQIATISGSYTPLSTTSALSGYLNTRIDALTTIVNGITGGSSGGGGGVSSAVYAGQVNCDLVNNVYAISHPAVNISQTYPLVSVESPSVSSTLFVQSLSNRTTTGFNILLSGIPSISGYKINWQVSISGASLPSTIVSVKDTTFGAIGNGVADDTAAIQAAETYCSGLSVPSSLYFPAGTYNISSTIVKQGSASWIGPGKIVRSDYLAPTGTRWPLVYAFQKNNWTIDGLSFRSIAHEVIDATGIVRKPGTGDGGTSTGTGVGCHGNDNTIIDCPMCDSWTIKNCTLEGFSFGIRYCFSTNFKILDNKLDSANSLTLTHMISGTYGTSGTFAQYLAINYGAIEANFVLPITGYNVASFGMIQRNQILATGLDGCISCVDQAYNQQPTVVSHNIVKGSNAGIQVYRGSVNDPTTGAPTYNMAVNISDNIIYCTKEQGIYVRGGCGVSIVNNYLERTGQGGTNGVPAGSSAGAICLRVNPFNDALTTIFTSAVSGSVSRDFSCLVANNTIVNHSRPGIAGDPAIIVRLVNADITHNTIVHDQLYLDSLTTAIIVDNGENINTCDINNNKVRGNWNNGIQFSGSLNARTSHYATSYKFTDNEIDGPVAGMFLDLNSFRAIIDRNKIKGRAATTNGIVLRNAPYSEITNNDIINVPTGIQIRSGCFASDVPRLIKGGTITNARRRGPTVRCTGNKFFNVTTPHNVSETGTGDISFKGRVRVWQDDEIDGIVYDPDTYALGIPAVGSWNVGDDTRNTTISISASPGAICVTPGHFATSSVATTGAMITSGSSIITLLTLTDFDGYGPGMYILPSTGWLAPVKITNINVNALQLTVASNAIASSSTVTLSVPTPTFGKIAALTP